MKATRQVVDVHAHVTPQRFQRAVEGGGEWHGLTAECGELDNPLNLWMPNRRLAEMDAIGVDVQVISPTDCFYQYDRPAKQTATIAADANEEIAEMVRDYPTRFAGLGILPMQSIPLAIAEMERAIVHLGLRGVEIDDHVNGATYDAEFFEDFWSAAEGLGALVFIHQFENTVVRHRLGQEYFLYNSIGNLADRTLTFAALVYGGVMDRHPELKVCLAHGGGYVPYALDRMDQGWEAWPESRGRTQDRPSTYARRFYYDTVTFTARNLRFMIDVLGADRLVFGSDWPAPMRVPDPVTWMESFDGLNDEERDLVMGKNAGGMLGRDVPLVQV